MPTLHVDWDDPAPVTEKWMDLDGKDFLEAIRRRDIPLPPLLQVLDITEGCAGDGWVEFTMKPQTFMLNLAGTVHGGALATLVDSALTCALVTKLPRGFACTTVDLQMRFFRPARVSSEVLTARADVVHRGTTLATTVGDIKDARGKVIVHATSTLAIAPSEALLKAR